MRSNNIFIKLSKKHGLKSAGKRFIAAALAVSLMLGGCAGVDQNNTSSQTGEGSLGVSDTGTGGKYRELDVTPEGDEILTLIKNPKGGFTMFSKGMVNRYDSLDGREWEKSDGPGKTQTELESAKHVAILDDGSLVVSLSAEDMSTPDRLVKISPEHGMGNLAIADYDSRIEKGSMLAIVALASFPGNRLLLSYYDMGGMGFSNLGEEIESEIAEGESQEELPEQDSNSTSFSASGDVINPAVFDAMTGEMLYELAGAYIYGNVAYDSEHFYFMDYDGSVNVRSLLDGKETDKIVGKQEAGDGFNFNTLAMDCTSNGECYSLESKGMSQIDRSTGERHSKMGGAAYAFGSGRTGAFFMLNQTDFLCLVDFEREWKLFRYEYDATAKQDPEQLLSIWTLNENSALRSAIYLFQKNHPEAAINLEVALDKNSAQTAEDAIKNLNTRILAGDGPDLVVLDGVPAESYAKKGLLKELSSLVNTEELYSSLVESLGENGIYYLPSRLQIPLLISSDSSESATSLEELVNKVEQGKGPAFGSMDSTDAFGKLAEDEKPLLSFMDFDELFKLLWDSSAAEIFRDNSVNSESLTALLNAAKEISTKYELIKEDDFQGMTMAIAAGGDGEILPWSLTSFINGTALAAAFTGGSLSLLKISEQGENIYSLFPGLAAGSYLPVNLMGIAENCKNEDFAVEFLQSVFSKESQAAMGSGLPVTMEGYESQLNKLEESDEDNMMFSKEFSMDIEDIVGGLKTPMLVDESIKQVVLEQAESYCKGEISLEKAISEIEAGTKIYLAERA